MNGSSALNGSTASSSRSRQRHRSVGARAKCQCGLPLMLYTAGTQENPERRFLRCRNWHLPGTCDFFFWIDEPVQEREPRHVEAEIDNSEIGESSNSMLPGADLKKKIKKLKKKLEIETFHKKVACLIALISWIVTFWFFCRDEKSLKG
ncbi:uncharacterized protein At4g04775-like [Lotus japonicus]|uniref:uncharacterized protein At4g04775-like n=1 Tax=Lotus japonicus TaxID=34305 RepID=UPI002585E558|nr:uncharacterized protein At4g04775-like [Lotus japonicus]XP_057434093.1 uncharacterized protein At4g04775-like [Lotus japonicus]XP_057440687.1 uncharacterized protein At4g04775-like [Lotus japonicus]